MSLSRKPFTRGTQTLHKGRREIAPVELDSTTRGATQVQNRLPARQSRPSRRPVTLFRPQNPPHADFSFRPTDFPASSYRLFRRPYRLVFVSLRGHSDESYGPQTVSILLTPGIDKRAKLNSRRENVEGCPDGEASRAHQRVRTWSSAHATVPIRRDSSVHCSVRQWALENPPVPTGESAGAHWRANVQGCLQSSLGE